MRRETKNVTGREEARTEEAGEDTTAVTMTVTESLPLPVSAVWQRRFHYMTTGRSCMSVRSRASSSLPRNTHNANLSVKMPHA